MTYGDSESLVFCDWWHPIWHRIYSRAEKVTPARCTGQVSETPPTLQPGGSARE